MQASNVCVKGGAGWIATNELKKQINETKSTKKEKQQAVTVLNSMFKMSDEINNLLN